MKDLLYSNKQLVYMAVDFWLQQMWKNHSDYKSMQYLQDNIEQLSKQEAVRGRP